MKNLYFKTAFTLAEVLLTLTIVGIVAALTIPSLIQNSQDTKMKSSWKKRYSELQQLILQAANDNNGTIRGAYLHSQDMAINIAQYLSYKQRCTSSNSKGNCWHADNQSWELGGDPMVWTAQPGFVLTNGTCLMLNYDPDCGGSDSGKCGYIRIDLNCLDKPNVIGKDIFAVHLKTTGVIPFGHQGDTGNEPDSDCQVGVIATGNDGLGCSTKYLLE